MVTAGGLEMKVAGRVQQARREIDPSRLGPLTRLSHCAPAAVGSCRVLNYEKMPDRMALTV